MIRTPYHKQIPLWLLVSLPVTLLLASISLYKQQDLVAALPHAGSRFNPSVISEASKIFGHKKPVEKTIIRDVPHDEYLAVCLYVRNQGLDMVEFFQHHYYEMGIRRFWVMDDNSDPPLSTFQYDFGIPHQAIDFVWYENTTEIPAGDQARLTSYCVQVHAVNHTWVAIIDTDEFFDTPGSETIEEILRDLEETRPDAGALGVNWQMHSSNHQIERAESARKTYLECISDGEDNMGETGNKHVKSIVRPVAYSSPQNPHTFNLQPGFISIGEHGDEMTMSAFRQPVTRDRISLHHYVLKSFEDYHDKTSRSGKDWNFWNLIEYQVDHVACPQMLKYFPKAPNRPHTYK